MKVPCSRSLWVTVAKRVCDGVAVVDNALDTPDELLFHYLQLCHTHGSCLRIPQTENYRFHCVPRRVRTVCSTATTGTVANNHVPTGRCSSALGMSLCELLDRHFSSRWIGRDGSIPWPPGSPDLTPLDDIVYATPVLNLQELRHRITDTIVTITPDMLQRTWVEIDYRLDIIRPTKGAHVEVVTRSPHLGFTGNLPWSIFATTCSFAAPRLRWTSSSKRSRSASPRGAGKGGIFQILRKPFVHTLFDTSWRTLAQSSPSTVTADNQCALNIGIFVHKTVESSLQVIELTLAGGWARNMVLYHDRPIRYPLHQDDSVRISVDFSVLEDCIFSPSSHVAVETILKRCTRQLDVSLTEVSLEMEPETFTTLVKRLQIHTRALPGTRTKKTSYHKLVRNQPHCGDRFGAETPVRLLASQQGDPRPIPGLATAVFSRVGIVPDDAAGRRVFTGVFSRSPRPCNTVLLYTRLASLPSVLKTSMLRACFEAGKRESDKDYTT
ncbi:hypothetical protein PR048_012146 [Dryococelus australis]|uniref:Uncharacterized protein n=1 Tax=Dryococelus australis TaxID=614101 RepID=A0ABQ9HP46_9NEOP|nr:hypothetical protein PR048_012146 [Dryococelus australis]